MPVALDPPGAQILTQLPAMEDGSFDAVDFSQFNVGNPARDGFTPRADARLSSASGAFSDVDVGASQTTLRTQ